ncbi:hypothetical protein [Streptomyces sp. NPDC055134]
MIGKGPKRRISSLLSRNGPPRALIISSIVSRVGNGLFNSAAVLYFTLVVHLPAAQAGVGLTMIGLTGLLAGVPAGNLADRYGPRTRVPRRWGHLKGRPRPGPPLRHLVPAATATGSSLHALTGPG